MVILFPASVSQKMRKEFAMNEHPWFPGSKNLTNATLIFFLFNIILFFYLAGLTYTILFKNLIIFKDFRDFRKHYDSIIVYDMVNIFFTYVGLMFNFFYVFNKVTHDQIHYKVILCAMMILEGHKIIFYMRGSDKTAFFIRIIIKIIINIKYFMVILFVILISFTSGSNYFIF